MSIAWFMRFVLICPVFRVVFEVRLFCVREKESFEFCYKEAADQ